MRRYLPKNVQELVHWYERYVSPLSLVAGFLADNFFLLRRVDLVRSNVLLFSYLLISALCILVLNIIESGRMRGNTVFRFAPILPVIVQFCFGGLFSGYLSLYSRSASFAVSWIFIAVLAGLLLGNERFTRLYVRFPFQIALYMLVLLSFLEFFLPVIFHRIGPVMFVASSIVSLLVIAFFLFLHAKFAPEIFRTGHRHAYAAVGIVFALFNILYFTNVIPPLPLALKDAGVYHGVVAGAADRYTLRGEQLPWYQGYLNYETTFHAAPGESVYVWSSVFAPSGLSTEIFHQWQFHDPATKEWRTTNTVSFPILGGRDGGFRGYSEKTNAAPGSWRVNVVTQYGQLIGRITFQVVPVPSPVPLVVSTR